MARVKKRLRMSKFERLLYVITILLLVITPVTVIFSQSTLSKINYEVEKNKKLVQRQKKKNESLNMKIDELASLDKIKKLAKEKGLCYDNDSIKSIIEGELKEEDKE